MSLNKQVKIILVETTNSGNIGSALRAMKTMNFSRLCLVKPKEFPSDAVETMAANAKDLIKNIEVVDSLDEALKNINFVVGTSSRMRKVPWPNETLQNASPNIIKEAKKKSKIAILFGREDRGLTNSELLLANKTFNIPTSQNNPSLNLSHAVSIVLYELNKSSKKNLNNELKVFNLASSKEVHDTFVEIEEMLLQVGYLLKHTSKAKISKFKNFILKANTSKHEINVLRGIVHQINWFLNNSKKK